MDKNWIKDLLEKVADGELLPDHALDKLKNLPYEDLHYAKVDHHRQLRNGFPEVIFGQGKTPDHVTQIAKALFAKGNNIMATRANNDQYLAVSKEFPQAEYHELARIIYISAHTPVQLSGSVAVLSAGTADLPVAEEAAVTAEIFGIKVDRIYDVGVAGIHRLFDQRHRLEKATVIIVVAGMEGALPSVVGGLVSAPVIAVPTSIGYGAHFSGLAPLLTMLNSCASGIGVVNIDNGFGAATLAHSILKIGAENKDDN